jgi:hypothetical protein
VGFEDEEQEAMTRRALAKFKAIFGLDSPPPFAPNARGARPGVPPPEGRQFAGAAEAPTTPDASPAPWGVAPGFSPAPADLKVGATAPNADLKVGATTSQADLMAGGTTPEEEDDDPYPDITEKQWEAREDVRQLLENILSHQVEMFDAQHHDLLRQSVAGPSPHERAAEIVPTHPNALLLQRIEDSNFRQVARMASLFIRMKRLEERPDEHRDRAA